MIDRNDINEYFEKQETTIYNLKELVSNLIYRMPYMNKAFSKEEQDNLFNASNKIIEVLLNTSRYKGPEGEEYCAWDDAKVSKEMKYVFDTIYKKEVK